MSAPLATSRNGGSPCFCGTGFALAAAGSQEKFAALGAGTLHAVLAGIGLNHGTEAAVEHVMAGFMTLSVHPDVVDGVRELRAARYRLVTLTNGSTAVAEGPVRPGRDRRRVRHAAIGGRRRSLEACRDAYQYAARRCGVSVKEMLSVAVHPWDIDGAARAGLTTAWINRAGTRYPDTSHRRPTPCHRSPNCPLSWPTDPGGHRRPTLIVSVGCGHPGFPRASGRDREAGRPARRAGVRAGAAGSGRPQRLQERGRAQRGRASASRRAAAACARCLTRHWPTGRGTGSGHPTRAAYQRPLVVRLATQLR